MYIGGDMHKSLVWQHHESDRVGYPMINCILGITNGKDLSFATIDFDTTVADPTARVRIIYGRGEKLTRIRPGSFPQLSHANK